MSPPRWRLRRLWTASLRRQLVIGVALVHAVLMTLLVRDVVGRERDVIRAATGRQAVAVAQAVAASSASWVLANDVEGLAEVIEGMRTYPDLLHVMVVSPSLRVLGHSQRARVGSFLTDPASLALRQGRSEGVLASGELAVEAAAPIHGADGRVLGWVRVELSHALSQAAVRATTRKGLLYTLAAILAGVLFAVALAWGLTRDLRHLASVSDSVRRGLPRRNTVSREDELGRLATDLNAMLDALEAQRRAGEALRDELARSEERLSRALTAADEALWEYTAADGSLAFFARGNSGLGIAGERERGGAILPIGEWMAKVHPEDAAALGTALAGGAGDLRADLRLANAAGAWITFEARGAVERGADGKVTRVAGTLIDVTAARSLEAERRALAAQLQQSQKMDALGRVAGGVAHDFNNMLTAILARVEVLRAEATSPAVREELDAVLSAARRASGVTAQILSFSRGRAADPAPVDGAAVLREVEALLAPTLAPDSPLQLRVASPVPWALAERAGLVQVLLNLTGNARDFHRGPGPIVVSVETAAVLGVCASCHQRVQGEWATFSVSDAGPGFDAAALPHAFEPFFTTRHGHGGSGLGLAVVHGLVHGWLGHVLLDTSPAGSRVRVLLPRAQPRDAPAAGPRGGSPASARLRVLLVDDEPLVGRAVKRMLEHHGFEVRFEETPEGALAALPGGGFAVVVSDYSMPTMTGTELARLAHKLLPGLPVIVCTGDPSRVVAGPEVASVQAKPVAFEELSLLIRKLGTPGPAPAAGLPSQGSAQVI